MSSRTPIRSSAPISLYRASWKLFSAEWLRGSGSILEDLRGDWEALFSSLLRTEPFAHIDWLAAYGAAFEKESIFAALAIRKNGALRAVLPFIEKSSCFRGIPAKTLRSLSGKHSCRFDVVASDHDRCETAFFAWQTLRTDPNWDVIEAVDVPEGANFEELVECAKSDGYLIAKWPTVMSPYLSIPIDGTDPFLNCPPKYKSARSRLKRAQQRLQAKGNVAFEVTTTDGKEAMQRFVALESSGWKGAQGSAIGSTIKTTEFYNRIAESFSRAGFLRIYTLWLNDTPVAMELGLVHGGTYFSPKAAYQEAFSACSPGHLLTRHIIADLAHNGISRYDFLGPRARHKTLWAGEILPHAHYLIFRPTPVGRLRHVLVHKIAPLLRRAKYALRGDPQALSAQYSPSPSTY